MNEFKTTVNRIVNKYLQWEEWCEKGGHNKDDDELYREWLEDTTQKIGDKLCNDLVNLCEDNEDMIMAIEEYFGKKPEEDVDNMNG